MTVASTIELDRTLFFPGRSGEEVEVRPGAYRVHGGPDGGLVLTSADRRSTYALRGSTTWHELGLSSPLALNLAGSEGEQHVMMLFPKGSLVQATGRSASRGRTPAESFMTTADLLEAVLEWQPPSLQEPLPFDKRILLSPWKQIWGTIQPGASPTGLGPSSVPPHWVSATVATCYPPPAGSYGPGGPGTESGVPPFPPGSEVRRGAFPSYIQSVTPVTVSSSASMVGRVLRLHVTSHVVTLGIPTILSMTWTDVYQIVPQASGPVTFPAVIVATGRVPTTPPAPTMTWPAEVQKRLTSPSGRGAPTEFELRLDGIWITTRICEYLGRFPGSPELRCQ
ncbi:MAG: hypothetical protein ABR599_06755 [Gemmatimonadota bacterium]